MNPKNNPMKPNPKKAVAALQRIAKRGGIKIKDPVAWQQEVRKDRIK